jgi:hypothetical protein
MKLKAGAVNEIATLAILVAANKKSTKFNMKKSLLALFLLTLLNTVAMACDEPVPKFIDDIRQQVIFVGEIHGTKEMPAFVGNLACYFAKKNVPVLLGLEMPADMQAALKTFHASNGDKQAKKKLLAHQFWQFAGNYGMASEAIFDLIELSRKLRVAGHEVIPFAFRHADSDLPLRKDEDHSLRNDLLMAANIQARALQYANYKVIILAGNVHAMKSPTSLSAASFLEKSIANFSILLSPQGGNTWGCSGKPGQTICGVGDVGVGALEDEGYNAVVPIKEVHASAPALVQAVKSKR